MYNTRVSNSCSQPLDMRKQCDYHRFNFHVISHVYFKYHIFWFRKAN